MSDDWEAILEKVDEICSIEGGYRMVSRSVAYKSRDGLFCVLKADKRDEDDGTSNVFHITMYDGTICVDGPFTDSKDEYWLAQVGRSDAIITPDWVHRTVRRDTRDSDFAGHGGAEFRFEFLVPGDHGAFTRQGLKVLLSGEEDNDLDGPVLVTRNCWYQGKIPPKHRHLFKVNAEMVVGFNPTRTG